LNYAGAVDEAVAVAEGLLTAADDTDNPGVVSFALLAYGSAYSDTDPSSTYGVLHRGLTIAQESGNRQAESQLAVNLARLAATHDDPTDVFDFITIAIRNNYDSGSFVFMASPLAILAAIFDRLGYYEPAATISGVAAIPLTRNAFPEVNTTITHLREVLGGVAYTSLVRAGKNMTNAAMAQYALNQIDRARAELLRG
jgi:hypothetical protein